MDTAYLFDLDGTLILTDHLHLDLWQTILATYHINLDTDMYRSRIRGKTDAAIWDAFGVGTVSERADHIRWKEEQFAKRKAVKNCWKHFRRKTYGPGWSPIPIRTSGD